ncbi:MAG: heme lyase CcmF/NrfE family subunit [Bacillota bacterium]
MFIASFGSLLLALALLVSSYTLYLNIAGVRKNNDDLLVKAQWGMTTVAMLVTLASFSLLFALVTNDFSLKYVFSYSARELPFPYKISAFWAGNAGSLLLWAEILALAGVVTSFFDGRKDKNLFGVVSGVILINLIFFLVSMILFDHPFARLPHAMADGRGLNPMLRTPWMVMHPVAIYLGYVGWVVPFSFAMGSLLLKRGGTDWIRLSRNWAVLSWLFLSLGNLLGAQWAYIELGWGGYWAWDPVENASFLPWLTGTAFIHSILMQERKGIFKAWNMALVIVTYCLTLYGTFLVRSGILSSVHAFPKSNLSYWFGFFMMAMLIWSLYLLIKSRVFLKSDYEITSFFSKETGFLLNNILLICSAGIIFLGTNLPIFTGFFTGVKRVVGEAWFNASAGPVLLGVILLIGICTTIPWKKGDLTSLGRHFLLPLACALMGVTILRLSGISHPWTLIGLSVVFFVLVSILRELIKVMGEWQRNWAAGSQRQNFPGFTRRRLGAQIVHLGLVLFTLGVVGDAFYSVEMIKTMEVGETISVSNINDYQITFQGVKGREEGVNGVIYSDLLVEKNGKSMGTITPEKIYYPNWESPRTEVVILGGPVEDLYIVLAGWSNKGQQGTFEIHINPLMNWLWIGGYVLVIGTMLVLWPGKRQVARQVDEGLS